MLKAKSTTKHITQSTHWIGVGMGLVLLSSCAGPMNPFGGMRTLQVPKDISQSPEILGAVAEQLDHDEAQDFEESEFMRNSRSPASITRKQMHLAARPHLQALIRFYPEKQIWHRSAPMQINIADTRELNPGFKIKVFYNKKDVTSQVLKDDRLSFSRDRRQLNIDISNIRFLPDRDNSIFVSYQRTQFDAPVVAEYRPPTCSLKGHSFIKDVDSLRSHRWIVNAIENHAKAEQMNPGMMVGLIAQESNFNPRAVSASKALGLTQITHSANNYVTQKFHHWPRYGQIEHMSFPEIKRLVELNKINHRNEWRLDIDKSIIGGLHYLTYLQDYWDRGRAEMKSQKHQNVIHSSIDDIILASYNSGPARVKKAILGHGKKWREASDLREARKYIGKVKSYCSEYSRPELPPASMAGTHNSISGVKYE